MFRIMTWTLLQNIPRFSEKSQVFTFYNFLFSISIFPSPAKRSIAGKLSQTLTGYKNDTEIYITTFFRKLFDASLKI